MKQQNTGNLGKRMLIHGGLSAVVGVVACCLIATAVWQEWILVPMGKTVTILMSNGALGLFCWAASKKMPSYRLLISLTVAAIYWVLCFLGKLVLFSDTPIRIGWNMVFPFAVALLAGIAASMEKTRRR